MDAARELNSEQACRNCGDTVHDHSWDCPHVICPVCKAAWIQENPPCEHLDLESDWNG